MRHASGAPKADHARGRPSDVSFVDFRDEGCKSFKQYVPGQPDSDAPKKDMLDAQ